MKYLGKIGFILGLLTLAFGLYVMFVVAPKADGAQATMDNICSTYQLQENQTYFDAPGYKEAYEAMERKVDFGGYVFFASMLPFLLCLIGSFKKDKLAWVGLVLSIGAFLIGALYGTHMFS